MKSSSHILLFFIFFLAAIPNALALRTDCSAQMVVLDEDNNFVESLVTYEIRFYENEDPTGGEAELATAVSGTGTPTDGLLDLTFDCQIELLAASDTIYMEVDINGETLSPRTEMNSVPFAALAGSLIGDLGQSITFSGGDLSVSGAGVITIAANSVALGTDTTGNYVGTLTGGAGISIADAGGTEDPTGEGLALTVSLEADSVTATEIVDGSVTNADMAADTLNFTAFSDSMTLDADITINSNNNDFSFQVTGDNGSGGSDIFQVGTVAVPSILGVYTEPVRGATIVGQGATEQLLNLSQFVFMANLSDTQRSQRLCHSGGDGAIDSREIADCDGAQADMAEFYGSDGSLSAGDVVVFDGPGFLFEDKNQKSSSKAFLTKSDQAYDSAAMGVVSSNPFGEILGEGIFDEDEDQVPLALIGRVPVHVTNKNGAIQTGDRLTSSDIPGYAMKATRSGHVIGMALEDFDAPQGEVLMFIQTGYWSGNPETNSTLSKGMITIPAGQDFMDVSHSGIESTTAISLTPKSNPDCFYWVENSEDGFRVKLSKKITKDLSFYWMIAP